MRIARSKRGLTTEVVVDSKGQSFEKNVKPEQMHDGDAALQFFSYIGKLQGEMTPEQKATVAREFDAMVSAQKQALGLPQARSPYQPGMVIKHEDGYGVVEQIIGTALQIRDFNERGKTFTSVINLVGTSEVEGRFGLEGLVLEVAEDSPSRISPAVAKLLESKEAVHDLFLSNVGVSSKIAVLDRLDCTPEEYLTILRHECSSDDPLVAQIAERAKDDRVYVFAALCRCPQLVDKVTDQSLLKMLAMQDGRELRRHLGDPPPHACYDALSLRALDSIQDQDKLYEIANTAHGSEVCEKAILKVEDDVKVREWIATSQGATILMVPEWTKRFSTWDSEDLNHMVFVTELLYNEGIFAAAAETGKLDVISYKAIVEKFERINPLDERVGHYLIRVEDREFVASKLRKWASGDSSSKKVVQSLEVCYVAEAIRAEKAHKPLSSDVAEMMAEIALLPAMFTGQSVENQSAYRATKFGLVDPVALKRVMKEAAMPEVRKLAEEKLADIRLGDTDTV